MWMLLALVLGILLGFFIPVDFPLEYSKYVSVAFLAGFDSVLGGVRSGIEKKFDGAIFITGFLFNVLFAALLTWVGDRLGVDLYLAAVVTFGVRIFQNLAFIRRDLIAKGRKDLEV
jgi:small basic protein